MRIALSAPTLILKAPVYAGSLFSSKKQCKMRLNHLLFYLLAIASFSTCDDEDDQATPDCSLMIEADTRFFEFQHGNTDQTYVAWTSDTSVINAVVDQLALPEEQRGRHINGVIKRLPEDCAELNTPWSWYFASDQWQLADISIEVCDGNPQFVEDNLSEFTDNVGRYCPWSAYVKREISNPLQ